MKCGNCNGTGYDMRGVKTTDPKKVMNRVCHVCNGSGQMTDKDNLPEPVAWMYEATNEWGGWNECAGIDRPEGFVHRNIRPLYGPDLMAALVKERERADRLIREDAIKADVNKMLLERAEQAEQWNGRVSVCQQNTPDIVDGPCVICELEQAERERDDVRASVDRIIAAFDAANESGKITDTIWMLDGPETMYDAIRALKEQK